MGTVVTGRNMPRYPLLAAAATGPRQGLWSVLVVAAFTVSAVAWASAPMYDEASENAAFTARRAAVPETAYQDEDAVVRLTASTSPRSEDQRSVLADLRGIPHLSEPTLSGSSVGAELIAPRLWESSLAAGGRRERARLFAVEAPAAALVPVGTPTRDDGLWMPAPLAEELGVRPGDAVDFAIATKEGTRTASVSIAGVYAVVPDSRRPADPPGSRRWARQRADLPADPGFRTLSAYLLVGDIATVERLAIELGDRMLWSVDATLDPGVTLAAAQETATRVETLRLRYLTAAPSEDADSQLGRRMASGIGRIATEARGVAGAVEQRTRSVEWAAMAVALGSVLAVALLLARRRATELRHAVGAGITPLGVGALWLFEHLWLAVVGAGAGWGVAWLLVSRVGPPGEITARSLWPGLVTAAGASLAGLLIVATVAVVIAARRVRPPLPASAPRQLPWGLLIVVAASTAGAGLAGTTKAGDGPRGVDLLVPLLVLGSVGVLGGMLLVRLARLRRRRRGAGAGGPGPRRQSWVVTWLARRRLAAGGNERAVTVAVLTAGLGMLLFALCALDATAANIDDRIAVRAGASGVAQIEGSWLLDKEAVMVPPPPDDDDPPQSEGLVPGVRTPPLPADVTLVWRVNASVVLGYGTRDVLVVDPDALLRIALWGRGADLTAARTALRALAEAGRVAAAAGTPIPAIAVADPTTAGSNSLPIDTGAWRGQLRVVSRLAAFPGLDGRPMYVVPATNAFTRFGVSDPRLRPRTRSNAALARTYLWSSSGARGVDAVLTAHQVKPERVETATALRQQVGVVAATRARGYQVAVATYLAMMAALALGVYGERTAAASRAGDLMLARVGLGRARALRARVAELVLLATAASTCAVVGVAVLAPLGSRLLDDDPSQVPGLRFGIPLSALAVMAAVAVGATAAAAAVTVVRSSGREEEAYRDDG